MHVAFKRVDHRPWNFPTTRWTWRQCWRELLFAHWPVPASELRPLVPDSLEIQEFDGTSWVGVVPFRMTGVMRRPFPNVPGASAFPELNLRLYVQFAGKPGVWFLSLDAFSRLAVWGAKRFFHLPYHHARIRHQRTVQSNNSPSPSDKPGEAAWIHFESERTSIAKDRISFQANYRPCSPPFEATPGSLEAFLVERYCLYAQSQNGQLFRGEVHHAPWPLQQAEGEVHAERLLAAQGITVHSAPPLLHYSQGVDVVVWPLEPLHQ